MSTTLKWISFDVSFVHLFLVFCVCVCVCVGGQGIENLFVS